MFVLIPTLDKPNRIVADEQHVQVVVNIRAEVLDAEVVRRRANVWLLDNVGNLLGATTPELILGERLLWRFDVILGIPNLAQPGSGALYRVGQILLDAETGEVENAESLIEELQASTSSITH